MSTTFIVKTVRNTVIAFLAMPFVLFAVNCAMSYQTIN